MLEDADQEHFYRLWYVEIKHSHIEQIALLGCITTRNRIHLQYDIDYSGDSL